MVFPMIRSPLALTLVAKSSACGESVSSKNDWPDWTSAPARVVPRFFPQSWSFRLRRWLASYQPLMAFLSPTGTPLTLLVRSAMPVWLPPSQEVPFGGGSMKTPFALGTTAVGSFPGTPLSPSRPTEFWICMSAAGKPNPSKVMNSSSPPTRRPASRPGGASIQLCLQRRSARCASNMSMVVAEPGPISQLFRRQAQAPVPALDPRSWPGVVVGRASHDLLNQAIKGCDTSGCFAAAKDTGTMNVDQSMPVGSIRSRSTSPSCSMEPHAVGGGE